VKILIGMPAPDSWGGPAACEPPFVEALRDLGHDVATEVYVYGDKDRPTPLLSRVSRVLRTAFRFRKRLNKGDFDLLHLNTAFDTRTILRDSASLFLMRPGRTKVFLKLHGSEAERFANASWFMKRLIRYIARKADGFGYFTSDELEAFAAIGFDRDKFYQVRNTLDIPLKRTWEREHKARGDIFELLFVSRFIPAKGLVGTIEACERLRRRGVRFRLTCIGDGPTRRDAEDAVGRLALGRVVTFTGYIPEEQVAEHMQRADIFVFPTTHPEGFPMVLFKAAALGLPIVTTNIRAAKDHMRESVNCLFCTKDPEDIADKIATLVSDVDLRREMSRSNEAFGAELYPQNIAREYERIYKTVLSQ
jgi:glycosyltransferase involved in cell wall biosynthesis